MTDWLPYYLTLLWPWLLSALVFFSLLRWIVAHWAAVSLWITDTLVYGLTLKAKRLARKPQEQLQDWFSSERVLCGDYARHYRAFLRSVEEYDRAESYLLNADEKERKPMPLWIKVVLFAIVIIEAFGFSYVFSGKAVPGASENVQVYVALGIAVLISVGMLVLTHATGRVFYLNSKIKKIRALFNNNRESNKPRLEQTRQASIQRDDEDQALPNYVRMLNRLRDIPPNVTPKRLLYFMLAAAVLIVIVLSYAVRSYVYEEQRAEETMGQRSFFGGSSNVPSAVRAPHDDAKKKADDDKGTSSEIAFKLTFVFLGVVFALIQWVAVWLSSIWDFAGIESERAYEITKDFSTHNELERYMDEKRRLITRMADNELTRLRQALTAVNAERGVDLSWEPLLQKGAERTFARYIAREAAS